MTTTLTKTTARKLMNDIQQEFVAVDTSLTKLRGKCLRFRDEEGWKFLGYSSLKTCINKEFRFSERRFHQLTAAAEVEKDIDSTVVQSQLTERTLRPLTRLKPEQRKAAFKQALTLAEEDNDENPVVTPTHTAAAAKKVANVLTKDEKTAKVYDGRKKTVHLDKLVPIFRQADEFKALMQAVSVLKAKMQGLALTTAGTVLKGEIERVEQHLVNVRNILKFSKPHSICVYCQGKAAKCTACNGTGWITEPVFNAAPKEKKG